MIVLGALTLICAIAWAYLAYIGWGMAHMDVGATMAVMPQMVSWGPVDLALVFAMWTIMMVAMMLPSAAPTILLFSTVSSRRRQQGVPAVPAAVFTAGYLLVWSLYAVLAAGVQWELHRHLLLSPAMASASPVLTGGVLVAAGLYQWLPMKRACLSHCRSPLGFFSSEWRDGVDGALWMGMRHGTICLGC